MDAEGGWGRHTQRERETVGEYVYLSLYVYVCVAGSLAVRLPLPLALVLVSRLCPVSVLLLVWPSLLSAGPWEDQAV